LSGSFAKMRNMKSLALKKPAKDQRERETLLGLVELYLKLGKPIGSNTLRENGFNHLSSATIRNYFSRLEEEGFLKQQHSSGGRIPTSLAYKVYAESLLPKGGTLPEKERSLLRKELIRETREIGHYLQHAAEVISEMSHCALFLSAPRFDQDFLLDVKFVSIDQSRSLCVLITDFGLIHTEVLYAEKRLSNFSLKRIEAYFHWRMTGLDKPEIDAEEEKLAQHFYSEIMLRHIANYTYFSAEDIYKTGFSKLLAYPDFNDASALASGLALFENPNNLRALLKECCKKGSLSCWIGDDLAQISGINTSCSVIAVPYQINQATVGAIALLGPSRIPYRHLFGLLQATSEAVSDSLTRSLYKFKITFRQPNLVSLDQTQRLLLENKPHEFPHE
jgi:heat-inducible transcriptional repressor